MRRLSSLGLAVVVGIAACGDDATDPPAPNPDAPTVVPTRPTPEQNAKADVLLSGKDW